VLDVAISSRAFSSGFDIKTPVGIFSAEKVWLSPTGEIRILNSSAVQIARLETESFFSSDYNIIITGGGFYQFGRDGDSGKAWICQGEGKLFRVSQNKGYQFLISDEAQKIAECSRSRFLNDYEVRVFNEADLKVVTCIFIALSLLEYRSSDVPD
jgi:hypothetical protein